MELAEAPERLVPLIGQLWSWPTFSLPMCVDLRDRITHLASAILSPGNFIGSRLGWRFNDLTLMPPHNQLISFDRCLQEGEAKLSESAGTMGNAKIVGVDKVRHIIDNQAHVATR